MSRPSTEDRAASWRCYSSVLMSLEAASVIEIFPVHWHEHVESSVSAFLSPIVAPDEPGDHADVTSGEQGCGVRTPCADAVADATCGFDCVWHIPNPLIFADW